AGVVCPRQWSESALLELFLECIAKGLIPFGVAAAPLVSRIPDVAAHEDVVSERWHAVCDPGIRATGRSRAGPGLLPCIVRTGRGFRQELLAVTWSAW